MPHRLIDDQIAALQKRKAELEAESARLEKEIEGLQSSKLENGVVDDTAMFPNGVVPQPIPGN